MEEEIKDLRYKVKILTAVLEKLYSRFSGLLPVNDKREIENAISTLKE